MGCILDYGWTTVEMESEYFKNLIFFKYDASSDVAT